ncbi:hypothetical protein B932_3298 [Gluconobacter oxydans H24]|nr:hypothetical protein B932_3298 [Gluconobacter oxydans H24]
MRKHDPVAVVPERAGAKKYLRIAVWRRHPHIVRTICA